MIGVYIPFDLSLSQEKKETLVKAAHDGTGVTVRLSQEEFHGRDELWLTRKPLGHIKKKKKR